MGYLTLHEGKTFRQYDDHWAEPPRYLVAIKSLLDKPNILWRTQYFRMGYRDIAGPGDQNISIFILPGSRPDIRLLSSTSLTVDPIRRHWRHWPPQIHLHLIGYYSYEFALTSISSCFSPLRFRHRLRSLTYYLTPLFVLHAIIGVTPFCGMSS